MSKLKKYRPNGQIVTLKIIRIDSSCLIEHGTDLRQLDEAGEYSSISCQEL